MQFLMFGNARVLMLMHHIDFTVEVVSGVEHNLIEDVIEFFQVSSRISGILKLSDKIEKDMVLCVNTLDSDLVLVIPWKHNDIQL